MLAHGFTSMALEASHVISKGPCSVWACAGTIDKTAPTATYFVQLIDSASAVTGGGAIVPILILAVDHINGVTDFWSFAPYIPDYHGVACDAAGAVVQLSTTEAVGTLAGAYMRAGGAR